MEFKHNSLPLSLDPLVKEPPVNQSGSPPCKKFAEAISLFIFVSPSPRQSYWLLLLRMEFCQGLCLRALNRCSLDNK